MTDLNKARENMIKSANAAEMTSSKALQSDALSDVDLAALEKRIPTASIEGRLGKRPDEA